MAEYELAEKFVSINGEGAKAGMPALFLRFYGCNLACSFCDTAWANEKSCEYTVVSEEDIYEYVVQAGIYNVTITGGEPLNRSGMDTLLYRLSTIENICIEIETNGSINLAPYRDISDKITFTMDYKLPGSAMTEKMRCSNFDILNADDTVKFVVSDENDLDAARDIIDRYSLPGKVHIYISPVYGRIAPEDIAEYMIRYKMNRVNMQLQMHKYIWEPNRRGV